MAIQRTPPPQQPPAKTSKAGLGCLGCGCLLLLVIFFVFAGLIGGGTYMGFKELQTVSSPTAEAITPFAGGDDVYTGVQQKITAFNQDVNAGKTSTLTLSADEINSLIEHNIDLKRLQAQVLVSMTGDLIRFQGSIPSNSIPLVNLGIKDRYFNLDATSAITFNPDTKEIEFQFRKIQIGDISLPENSVESLQTSYSQMFNQKLRQNTAIWNVLQVAKNVSIKDGQLVIETK